MTNVSFIEAKVEAAKQSKLTKDTVYSVIVSAEDPEGFDVVQGDHPDSQLTYLNGAKRSNGPIEKEEKTPVAQQSKKSSTKKSEPVMTKTTTKKAAGKKPAAKKATGTKKGPDQPFAWIIAMVQEKKKVNKADIRKALEKDYAPSTCNVQMARLKNSPLLKVDGDVVTAKK